MKKPLDPFSEVTDERRRWTPDWYAWLGDLIADIEGSVSTRGSIVNVRDFGAVGDGATDDTEAIQGAIDYVHTTFYSGIVYFPPGNPYLISDTIVVNASITLLGGGTHNGTSIMTRTDITVVRLNHLWAQLCNMMIIGKGANADQGSFGATQPAVIMNSVSGKMFHMLVNGGAPCIKCMTDDTYLEDVMAAGTYGDCIVQCDRVTFMARCKIDDQWPAGIPPQGAFNAWASSTVYSVGTVVLATHEGEDWYMQCAITGTSGGSQPTLKNYGVPIVDGTATWLLVARPTMDCVHINFSEFHGTSTDISGIGRHGILVNAPRFTFIHQFIIGQQWSGSIRADSGSNLYVNQCELNTGVNNGTSAVQIHGSWSEDAVISDCTVFGTLGTSCNGVDIAGGIDTRITNNQIKNCDVGVIVRPGVSNFIVAENAIRNCPMPVGIEAGSSNYYNIVNNLVNSSGLIADGGTGVNKTITGNV